MFVLFYLDLKDIYVLQKKLYNQEINSKNFGSFKCYLKCYLIAMQQKLHAQHFLYCIS